MIRLFCQLEFVWIDCCLRENQNQRKNGVNISSCGQKHQQTQINAQQANNLKMTYNERKIWWAYTPQHKTGDV